GCPVRPAASCPRTATADPRDGAGPPGRGRGAAPPSVGAASAANGGVRISVAQTFAAEAAPTGHLASGLGSRSRQHGFAPAGSCRRAALSSPAPAHVPPSHRNTSTVTINPQQRDRIASGKGFIAALDQSGGSTPKALKLYGVDESAYSNEKEMFDQVHAMRTRIVTSPAFTGERVLGAILFERTMDDDFGGKNAVAYLWEDKGVVP